MLVLAKWADKILDYINTKYVYIILSKLKVCDIHKYIKWKYLIAINIVYAIWIIIRYSIKLNVYHCELMLSLRDVCYIVWAVFANTQYIKED